MPIRFKCGECGAAMTIKDELAGTSGKCPKCKTAFKVPGGEAQTPAPAEVSEEDAIFGRDFFSMNEPVKRPRYIAPTDDDDDDSEDAPASPPKKRIPAPAPPRAEDDNAASSAGALLSKTGKKNRPSDYVEPVPGKVEYDYSEVKYRFTHQVLPLLAVLLIAVPLLYYTVESMFGDKVDLPDLAPLSGTVTLDGKPVAARLDIIPVIETADQHHMRTGSSIAQSGPDGKYVAVFNPEHEGAVVGRNLVRIKAAGFRFEETIKVNRDNPEYDSKLKIPTGAKSETDPEQQ